MHLGYDLDASWSAYRIVARAVFSPPASSAKAGRVTEFAKPENGKREAAVETDGVGR
jgi:hypothetical protein